MFTAIWIIQFVTAILLILLVLMHSPKGDGIGGIGGASHLFSSQKSAEAGISHTLSKCEKKFCVFMGFFPH